MNSSIIINLPVAAIGQQPAASKNPQRQFADVLSSNSSLNIGKHADFSLVSSNMPFLSQVQNFSHVKEAFSEKFKKVLATVSGSNVAKAGLNTDPLVLQQNSNIKAVIPDLTGIIDSATEKPEITVSADLVEGESENTPAAEAPDVLAISSITVLPIETTMLPLVNEDNSIPTDSGIGQKSCFIKPDIVNSATNDGEIGQKSCFIKPDIVNSTTNDGEIGQKSCFIKPDIVNSAINETNVQNISSKDTDADVTAAGVKNENLELPPQAVVAAKDSTIIKTVDAGAKEQNTVSNQNFAQKVNISQPQTNAENSSQMPFKQGFDGAYQKVEDIESISLENKKADDLQMLPIQEIKTAGGSEKISSPVAVNLKTDIQRETGEISKQIADSIKSAANSGDREITVRLNPAELGKVVIKVSAEHSQISTVIEASNPETKSLLQEAFGQVAKNLADAGITLRQFEVRLAGQPGSGFGSAFSQSAQSGQSGQGNQGWSGQFFQSQNPTEGGFYYQSQTFGVKNPSSEQNFPQDYFTARSVNMLA